MQHRLLVPKEVQGLSSYHSARVKSPSFSAGTFFKRLTLPAPSLLDGPKDTDKSEVRSAPALCDKWNTCSQLDDQWTGWGFPNRVIAHSYDEMAESVWELSAEGTQLRLGPWHGAVCISNSSLAWLRYQDTCRTYWQSGFWLGAGKLKHPKPALLLSVLLWLCMSAYF